MPVRSWFENVVLDRMCWMDANYISYIILMKEDEREWNDVCRESQSRKWQKTFELATRKKELVVSRGLIDSLPPPLYMNQFRKNFKVSSHKKWYWYTLLRTTYPRYQIPTRRHRRHPIHRFPNFHFHHYCCCCCYYCCCYDYCSCDGGADNGVAVACHVAGRVGALSHAVFKYRYAILYEQYMSWRWYI